MDIQRDISAESNAELWQKIRCFTALKAAIHWPNGVDSPEVDNEVAIRSGDAHLRVSDFCLERSSQPQGRPAGKLLKAWRRKWPAPLFLLRFAEDLFSFFSDLCHIGCIIKVLAVHPHIQECTFYTSSCTKGTYSCICH